MVTDYPDADLVENLEWNISTTGSSLLPPHQPAPAAVLQASGYLWGASPQKLLGHLPPSPQAGFDLLLLADLLFNHSCHEALVSTILQTLARTSQARALVFFTPYRPWLLGRDMAFFDVCRGQGLEVGQVVEEVMGEVMFEEDEGDELLRRTVFGYEVRWRDLRETE